jgi:TolB-like protein/DNA-binding winged helix-turn-helix (wHTH) protein/Flp pilus assembly protein TadD
MLDFRGVGNGNGNQKVRFSVFEIDVRERELRKHGLRVKLEDQPFEILLALIEKPGELVTRSELQARLWPDGIFVDFEKSLTRAVNKLRVALGDSAATPRFIDTLPRRGYRFLAPVEVGHDEPAPASPESAPPSAPTEPVKPRRRRLALAAAAGVFAVAAGLGWGTFSNRSRLATSIYKVESLAVLPIRNVSGDPNQDYYADGLTDALITSLARIGSLRVISQTSAMRYKGTNKAVPEIARELGVDAVLEGSAALTDGRAQVRMRLVFGPADRQLWSESYEDNALQAARLQGRIALAVAQQVSARVVAGAKAGLSDPGTANPKAYNAYLRGRALYNLRTAADILAARSYFDEALREDPNFALAWAGLADTHIIGSGVPLNGRLAEQFARKALSIDPKLAEAYVSLGFVYQSDHRFDEAGREIRRALELGPGYMMSHQIHTIHLLTLGRLDEALEANSRALRIDPFSWPLNNMRGFILVNMRRYEDALQHLQFFNELAPQSISPFEQLARVHWLQESPAALVAEREAALRSSSLGLAKRQDEVEAAYKSGGIRSACRRAAQLREQTFWRADGTVSGGGGPHMTVLLFACARDTAKVLELLEKRLRRKTYGDPMLLKTAPELDYLRDDPRFRDLLKRFGLPD